jgi:DNA-binding IclR family transcriptional regulator
MPLHLGSAARVLLAHLPRAERDRYLAGLPAEERRRQAATLSDQALDAIVRDGWTESFEEVDEGIWGTAAVIVSDGKPVAAVGTAGPMYRLVEERRRQIVDLIRDRADKISADLTGRY